MTDLQTVSEPGASTQFFLSGVAQIGLSLTTLVTVFLFFLGSCYWSGFLYSFGTNQTAIGIPITQLMIPSLQSVFLIYHAILTYMIMRWETQSDEAYERLNSEIQDIKQRQKEIELDPKEAAIATIQTKIEDLQVRGTRNLARFSPGKTEGIFIEKIVPGLSVVAFLILLFRMDYLSLGSILVGTGIGCAGFFFIHKVKSHGFRLYGCALLISFCLAHALVVGIVESHRPTSLLVSIKTSGNQEPLICEEIVPTPEGILVRLAPGAEPQKTRRIWFIPTKEIQLKEYFSH